MGRWIVTYNKRMKKHHSVCIELPVPSSLITHFPLGIHLVFYMTLKVLFFISSCPHTPSVVNRGSVNLVLALELGGAGYLQVAERWGNSQSVRSS